jgi:hypothetical protein
MFPECGRSGGKLFKIEILNIVLSKKFIKFADTKFAKFFEFVKLIEFDNSLLRGGLALSSQTVGSFLRPPGW